MSRRDRAFALGSVVLVAITLGIGFWETGSPERQRELLTDERRVNDLRAIAEEVYRLWTAAPPEERKLPSALATLANRPGRVPVETRDPLTREPYGYRAGEGSVYQLCATFQHGKEVQDGRKLFWAREVGTKCFDLDAATPPPYE